ncbi:MAG TPA: glycine--tRNA ligase subunit beta [Burkholderiaceae bacterium]|jgi:glycyl-tRNA synthetase beta chain
MSQTLLVELLTEELPPKALNKLSEAFAAGIVAGLKARDFLEADAVATAYASPRRLAVSITKVRAASPDKSIREKILPVAIALDGEGNPSAPLAKKLAALANTIKIAAIAVTDLERAQDGKAESFFYTYTAAGSALHLGLQAALEEGIAKLPIPKVMSYQRPDGETVQFVRPVHKLTALHGSDVVPIAILGLAAGRVTLGHRFLSHGELSLNHANDYAVVLETQGKVISDASARKEKIRAALLDKAGADQVLMPESLLDEVNALVEWPVVYACHFEEEFLSVPQECLILTMQTNQKYFALTDAAGRLRSRFLIVSNLETSDPQHIVGGNERVVRPRLSDAKFFFEQDKKKRLADRLPGLANVVYHNKLGTQAQRTGRITQLAGKIAATLGNDVALAERAAQLAKTDLLTDMVGEFPELQGIMGTYYARHDGEPEEVALAASEHYQPRFAGDALPASNAGTAVALADKLETLIGIWGIGLQPTGDRDPFALRRHALGVLRMLIEKRLPLSLPKLLKDTASMFSDNPHFIDRSTDVWLFMLDRLRGLLRERGYAPNEVEAVMPDPVENEFADALTMPSFAQRREELNDILERLNAVKTFVQLPEATALASANKRITNILKKNVFGTLTGYKSELLREPAEIALAASMVRCEIVSSSAFAERNFTDALVSLAPLQIDVDLFFDKVMVMDEDLSLRNNRIALLSGLHQMMNRVADISKLAA